MEKVNFKNQLLVHLSTVAGSKNSDLSWVNIQSARTEYHLVRAEAGTGWGDLASQARCFGGLAENVA